jgi:hypothetical protein
MLLLTDGWFCKCLCGSQQNYWPSIPLQEHLFCNFYTFPLYLLEQSTGWRVLLNNITWTSNSSCSSFRKCQFYEQALLSVLLTGGSSSNLGRDVTFLYIKDGQRQPLEGHKNRKDSPEGRACTCTVGSVDRIKYNAVIDQHNIVLLLFIKDAILCSLDLLLYSVC